MDLLQTIAFLQWLTDEQPFDTWEKEGLDQGAWIKANGFDPGIVLAGIEDLKQRNILPSTFNDLASGSLSRDAKNRWLKAAQEWCIRQKSLMELAGGSGSSLKQIRQTYQKSLININKHTDQEIEKEIEAKIEKTIEHQIVEGLNKEFPKYTGKWSIGAKAAEQDYKEKTINENQKSFLAARGITTNEWYGYTMEGYTKGFQINFKNGGYISVEKASSYGYSLQGMLGAQHQYWFAWQETNYSSNKNNKATWSLFSEYISFEDTKILAPYLNENNGYYWYTYEPVIWNLDQATTQLEKEEKFAAKANKTIESPYVKLALKYDLGDKRYSNLASIYDALKYIQKAKFENFDLVNKIKFTLAMIELEYDLLTKKFSKYHRLYSRSKFIYDALDTPDKIYQKTFALWWIRGSIKIDRSDAKIEHGTSDDGESWTTVEIELTNENKGQEYQIRATKDQYGYEIGAWRWTDRWGGGVNWQWSQVMLRYTVERAQELADTEKQSDSFKQLQSIWLKEKIFYNNLKRTEENPILNRILHHEAQRYIKNNKYYQSNKLLINNKLISIQARWQKECKALPWLKLITTNSLFLLLERLNSVDFKMLNTKQKVSLLCDLYYAQNDHKPYKEKIRAFYCGYKLFIHTAERLLYKINKATTEIVAIAWRQIVAGTYRIKTSTLPVYQQLINKYIIESVAKQNPSLIYANKSGIGIEGNSIGVSINKETPFSSNSKVEQKPIFEFTLTDTKGTKSFWYPTSYTPHQFALRWERKWFESKQEKWAQQTYNQIQAFDSWYKRISAFPLLSDILRRDLHRSKYWNRQYNNKAFLYLHNHGLLKDIPRQGAIVSALLLFVNIDKNGLTKNQKRWLRKQTEILQLSIFFDIVAIRTSVAIFVRRHQSLIKQLSSEAKSVEKITPDKLYQQTINNYIFNKLEDANLQYDQYYKLPDTEAQVKVLKAETYDGAEYDVVISLPNAPSGSRGYTSIFVSKQPQGWIANYIEQDKIWNLDNFHVSKHDNYIVKHWYNSRSGKIEVEQYKQLKAFYNHTKWLLSLAFVPHYLRNDSKLKHLKIYELKYSSLVNTRKLSRDLRYFFSFNFEDLNSREKVLMIADYDLFVTYELPNLGQHIRRRIRNESNRVIDQAYQRLNALAKASMKITPAEIYQHEFDQLFGITKWTENKDTNKYHIEVQKEYNSSTDASNYNIEIYNENSERDLIAKKQSQSWQVEGSGFNQSGNGLVLTVGLGGYFNLTYNPIVHNQIRQLTISGQWKGSITISTKKQIINIPTFRTLKELKPEYLSLMYLSGFLKNDLIKATARNYIKRHRKLKNISKLLPSTKRLENTIEYAKSVDFKALTRKDKTILYLDYYRVAYSIAIRYKQISDQERKFLGQDIRLLIDISTILQVHKIEPGQHGEIDQSFDLYAKGNVINIAILRTKEYIYAIRHPKPHNRRWKQWKTWNERIYPLISLTRLFGFIAVSENIFYNIEKKALKAAYDTYQVDLNAGETKKESLKFADRAYLETLYSEDQALWSMYQKAVGKVKSTKYNIKYDFWYGDFKIKTPKGWSEEKTVEVADKKASQLAKDSIEDIYYREIVASRKLLHIQNDKFARKIRLEYYLLGQIIEEKLATSYLSKYQALIKKERKSLKRGHLYHFFTDLGLAVWDLVKAPFSIIIVSWKDLIKGDGFFYSWDAGLEAGVHNVKKSINHLADDVKDLFLLVDGLFDDLKWVGTETIFRWCRYVGFIKKIDGGIEHALFDVEMGAVVIGKAIIEMPLTLAKDINKIGKGLVFWAEGKVTFKQMIYNDIEPVVHTIHRLSKFLDNLFTDPKVIKEKIGDVRTLLHYMKIKYELKYVMRVERFDRHTRKRLHHQTFGLIKSPFEKFKQRHKGLYYALKLTNSQFIQTGYFTSHPDEAIAEAQMDAIYSEQVKLNAMSNKTDLQRAKQQLTNQFNTDKKNLSTQQKAIDTAIFLSASNKEKSKLVQRFVVKDFESYFNFNSSKLKSIKKEDKKGIHLFIKKEGKLHLASFSVNLLEKWMNSVIKRQRNYVLAYQELYINHPKYASNLLGLDCLSAFYADVRKEQKIINSDWLTWGSKDGKMFFNALTEFFLPNFSISQVSSNFFGLSLPFTVLSSEDKEMTTAQKKKIKTYDNKHHIGEKIFDMILWTYFLNEHNITKLPAIRWFTHNKITPSSPLEKYVFLYQKRISKYKTRYLEFLKTYEVYRNNYQLINSLLEMPIESLAQINSELKIFEENSSVSGFYKDLFQEILTFDYSKNRYSQWLKNMNEYHKKQLDYLNDDKYVLGYEVEQGKTVTVGDVLLTFTPKGEEKTNVTYDQLNNIIPPQPSPAVPPNPKNEIKKLDRAMRVSPIALFKNYEIIKHVSKAFRDKSLKKDASILEDKVLAEGEAKIKVKEAELIDIETDAALIELDNKVDASEKGVKNTLVDAFSETESELDGTITDIETDFKIIEDV
jgi:hypothetical protein